MPNTHETLTSLFSDIADAIREKTGATEVIKADNFPAAINNINSIAPLKDVNFYDYDGTIVKSYLASEFAALTAMPDNPTHSGLTAQGWNWSLADAKTYVAKYGKLNIGQMYITDDGKTRIYIRLEEGRLAPYLGIAINGTATVEWGDGTTDTVTGTSTSTVVNTQHTYARAGDYTIAIAVSGSMALVGNSSYGSQVLWKNSTTGNQNRAYQNAIQKVEIGSNTSISNYAFSNCYGLSSVTIPDSITSIGGSVFYNCYGLSSVTIPDSVTSIGDNVLAGCHGLGSVMLPDSVTSIGSFAFSNCQGLSSVTIPDSVTSISIYTFNYCYSLGFIKFERTAPPTVSNSNAWQGVPTDCVIYVPSGTLAAYTSATNYPDPTVYTYVEY